MKEKDLLLPLPPFLDQTEAVDAVVVLLVAGLEKRSDRRSLWRSRPLFEREAPKTTTRRRRKKTGIETESASRCFLNIFRRREPSQSRQTVPLAAKPLAVGISFPFFSFFLSFSFDKITRKIKREDQERGEIERREKREERREKREERREKREDQERDQETESQTL